MLKISKLADYAVSIVLALSAQDSCASVAKIARITLIPAPTVSKILKKLVNERLVISVQGSQGGYQLARPVSDISVAELISAIDGRPAITECCKPVYHCAQEKVCTQKRNWQWINQQVFSVLHHISIQEMREQLRL